MTSPMMLKKILATLAVTMLLIPQLVFAQSATLLPGKSANIEAFKQEYNNFPKEEKEKLAKQGINNACEYFLRFVEETVQAPGDDIYSTRDYIRVASAEDRSDVLACAIESGGIHLWMLPYFITGIVNFLIYIAGTVAVLFVLLGGFWYMTGGLTDDKEKGKKTITYALMGLVITLLAWIIVNIIMVQVTG